MAATHSQMLGTEYRGVAGRRLAVGGVPDVRDRAASAPAG